MLVEITYVVIICVGLLGFYFFCPSVCLYSSLCICASMCNPSQVLKESLLGDFNWPSNEKVIKTQWLAPGEWSCHLANYLKLVVTQPNSSAVSKHLGILQKIRGGGNSAKVWVKTVSLERIIFFLVYWTCM